MREVKSTAMNASDWGLLLALSALWGGSFFFYKILAADYPPFTVVLVRVGLAALLLHLVLLARRDFVPRDPHLWAQFFVMGLINNVAPFSLIVFGETRISSGLASILNATTPIFTVLVAHALTRDERLTAAKAAGVLCGFAGVAVLLGPGALAGLGRDLVGEGACLIAALAYAFAGVYGRRFRAAKPIHVAAGQLTASTILLLPLAAAVDRPWTLPAPGLHAIAAFAALAFLSTALAFILYFRLLATAGATNLLLVTFLLPVSALALGVLFLGETVSGEAFAGMALIGLGLAAIDGRAPRALWRRFAAAPQGANS